MSDIAVSSVKSAQRALEIIEILAASGEGLTLTEVAARLQLPKSSAHALLHTLRHHGFVSLDEARRTFHLGLRLWEIGHAFPLHEEVVRQALPVMRALVDEFDEICQLAVRDGLFNVYLAKVDGRQPIRLISQVGARLYCHATGLGKALLACEPEAVIDDLYAGVALPRFTANTITDLAALKSELRRIRERGHAEDREEYVPGLRCVAAPVLAADGRPLAALSLSMPAQRAPEERVQAAAALVRGAAAAVAARLSPRGPATDPPPLNRAAVAAS
jgi:DNA-binding IclR family transcriptional regulator